MRTPPLFLLAFLLLAATALAHTAAAQPDDRSKLPSLTPAVFESRGTVSVAVPDVDRQPLSGFGPPPRTYVLPADREPITRPYDPNLDALPALALAPPPEPERVDFALRRFRAEGGGGLDASRYGRLDLSALGAAGEFFVDADYDGINGDPDRVRFDRMEVRAGGRSFSAGRVRIEGHALLDGYSTPAVSNPSRRRRRALGAEVGLEGVGGVAYALTAGFEQGRLSRSDDTEPETNEGRIDVQGRLGLFRNAIRVDGATGLAGAGALGSDVLYGAAGLAVAIGRAEDVRLVFGARVLAFDATAEAGSGNATSIGPIVDIQLPFGRSRLFITNDPHLGVRSLTDLTETNPFVRASPIVAPDVVPLDTRVGVELRPGPARLRAYATATYAPTYLIFERSGGQFSEAYVEAEHYGVGAVATVAAASGLTASVGAELRRGVIEGGDRIPFFAPLVGRAGVQVPFAQGRGRVGLSAHAESARPDDRTATRNAPAWARLSLDARYDVVRPLSLVLRGERLAGPAEQWPGSPEPPYTVMLGLRLAR